MSGRTRTGVIGGGLVLTLLTLACGGDSPSGPSGPPTQPPGPTTPPTTPPPPGPELFTGAGDIAVCGGNAEATARLLDGIGGRFFTLGDNAYPSGSRENFRNCYEPSWGRHKARTFPSPGNHDYEQPNASAYFEYFGSNAGVPGLGYYSFDLGAWHVISLNSNIPAAEASAQGFWLADDLATSSATCTLAYWHHPVMSSGRNGDHPHMRPFFRMLHNAGADLILAGHDHTYERFAPQDADGRPDSRRGIRQFIVGTGGVPLYEFPLVRPNSEMRILAHGVLKLTLEAQGYQWEFLTTSGRGGDVGSGTCH
jgi:hypothetical protein